MNSFSWVAGDGRWHTLSQCLGGDSLMVALVVLLDGLVALLYLWIAFYWYRCERASRGLRAVSAMRSLRHIFIWCSLSGYGFTLLKLFYPAWWLWVVFTVVLIFYCFRFLLLMRDGLVLVYQDIETLRRVRESLRFMETGHMELSAIKDQLCVVKAMVFNDASQTTSDMFWRVCLSGFVSNQTIHSSASGTVTIDERVTTHVFDMSGAATLTLALSGSRFGSNVGESEGQLYFLFFNQGASAQTITLPSSFKTRGWRPERRANARSFCILQRVTIGGSTEYHLLAASDSHTDRDSISVQNGVNENSTRILTQTSNKLQYSLNAGSASYDATLTLSSTYAQRGDWWDIMFVKAASSNPAIDVKNHDASSLMTINSGHGSSAAMRVHARFVYDGTNWLLDHAKEAKTSF